MVWLKEHYEEIMRALTIFILIVVALVVLFFLGMSRAPDMLANKLSKSLGVSVSIDSMSLRPSKIEVDKIEIGNARGYSLPKAFSAEEIKVHAPLTRYVSDDIVIDEIDVNHIYLGLEFDSPAGAEGNWTKIMNHYKKEAEGEESSDKKILIKKLILTNIQTELLFRSEGGKIKKLPTIKRIELTNINTEGSFPTKQLMGTILGQMLKEVFIQQNLDNMIKGLLNPGKAVDKILKPFEGIFNTLPKGEYNDCA